MDAGASRHEHRGGSHLVSVDVEGAQGDDRAADSIRVCCRAGRRVAEVTDVNRDLRARGGERTGRPWREELTSQTGCDVRHLGAGLGLAGGRGANHGMQPLAGGAAWQWPEDDALTGTAGV